MRVLHLYTGHAQANSRSDPHPSVFLSVRSSYNVLLDKPLQFGPCVKATQSGAFVLFPAHSQDRQEEMLAIT